MIVFKTYSILMVTIFILSLRKLHATPPIPPEIQKKIDTCIGRIYEAFGEGDTRDHGKIALEHFAHIPEDTYQKECCFSTLTEKAYYDSDTLGYYLSFREYLHVDGMTDYKSFCEELQSLILLQTSRCVDLLERVFKAVNLYDALIYIFYKVYKKSIHPHYFTKTIHYVEPEYNKYTIDGDVYYVYPNTESIVMRVDGQIEHTHPNTKDVTIIYPPNGLTELDNNHLVINHAEVELIYIPSFYTNFDPDADDPPNTVHLAELYVEKIQDTYGLDIANMPPPEIFCREEYFPSK